MSEDRNDPRKSEARRRHVRRTVVILAVIAAAIYFGFIARGVLG